MAYDTRETSIFDVHPMLIDILRGVTQYTHFHLEPCEKWRNTRGNVNDDRMLILFEAEYSPGSYNLTSLKPRTSRLYFCWLWYELIGWTLTL